MSGFMPDIVGRGSAAVYSQPALSAPRIHPTALIDPAAQVDSTAQVGAYAIVGPDVRLGPDVNIGPHAFITGWTELAESVRVWPFASVGCEPQDLSYDGARTYVRIGARTQIREGVAIHRGTAEDSETVIGADCLFMNHSHVAHNCRVGDNVIFANGALLGGHVTVGDRCFLSGNATAHQFVRIGRLAMLAGNSRARRDVPPFTTLNHDTRIDGINAVGMKRNGVTREARGELLMMVRTLRSLQGGFEETVERFRREAKSGEAAEFVAFLQTPSKRGSCPFSPRDSQL